MHQDQLKDIIQRYLRGDATSKEVDALHDWYHSFNDEEVDLQLEEGENRAMLQQKLLDRLEAVVVPQKDNHKVHFLRSSWLRYAAAIILIAGISMYFWLHNSVQKPLITQKPVQVQSIPPGQDGAILTLADGSTLVLDSANNGVIASQKGARVILNDGQLVYDITKEPVTEAGYNTITTPKGRQFKIVLPDGTKVWLNAASSLRYPTFFSGIQRKVEITGEAYFEVAENRIKPFYVEMNNASLEVLGTGFNINTYSDEPVSRITLVEGSVKVMAPGSVFVMKPGQQVRLTQASQKMVLKQNANVNEAIAWKNGLILFENSDLASIMRQVSRWYDVEVVYQGPVPERIFTGEISRDMNVSELLKILNLSDIRFKVQDKTITVLP